MDGPVIADAVHRALKGGTRVKDVLDMVEAIAGAGTAALVMTYWNPVDQYGVDAFARDLASAGGSGLITPDLTPEESGDWPRVADEHGLDRVYLVAPSSTRRRGSPRSPPVPRLRLRRQPDGHHRHPGRPSAPAPARLVARTREHTTLPVAVGLGVSTADQANEVAGFADGVIVGSAFVRRLAAAADPARRHHRRPRADRRRWPPASAALAPPGPPGASPRVGWSR